jgi:NhaP-type Na+/H+ or K+/H+ antiporter
VPFAAPLPSFQITSPDVVYVVGGVGLLLAAVLPRLLRGRAVSAAMAFAGVGVIVGLLPVPLPDVDPVGRSEIAERLTEITVIVAIMGVAMSIDRPLSWRRWATTWRLLAVTMPLSIAAVAVLGWGLMGLAPAAAVLLAAVLAPTDPVLAGDVQLQGPGEGSDDEVRFGLTSEAALNDGLAFPFVYLAVFLAADVSITEGALRWVGWELVGKVVVGVAVGTAIGWVLSRLAFRLGERWSPRYGQAGEAVIVLAAVFLAYGAAEAAQGYGFLAVAAAALVGRQYEREHEYHRVLHTFSEQIERLLTLGLLLLFGVACAQGLLADLTWRGAVTGLALVLVLRPVAGWLGLVGTGAGRRQRAALAFFGVRGIGSLYYLAYAAGEERFPETDELWATVGFTILVSIVVHGALASPAMERLDRAHGVDPGHGLDRGGPA